MRVFTVIVTSGTGKDKDKTAEEKRKSKKSADKRSSFPPKSVPFCGPPFLLTPSLAPPAALSLSLPLNFSRRTRARRVADYNKERA